MQDTPKTNIEDLPSWIATDETQLIQCFRLIDEVTNKIRDKTQTQTTYKQGQGGIIL